MAEVVRLTPEHRGQILLTQSALREISTMIY